MGFSIFGLIPWPWRLMGGLALFLAIYGTGYWRGHAAAAHACQQATLKAKLEAAQRDQQAADKVDKYDQVAVEMLRDLAAQLEREKISYEAELQKRPAAKRCPPYSARDIKRLRQLRGQAQPG